MIRQYSPGHLLGPSYLSQAKMLARNAIRGVKIDNINMPLVEVVEYIGLWIRNFESERTRLEEVLGPVALKIHHIGSTAVPGLAAKPIIDILIEVGDLTSLDSRNPEMIALGYVPRGELGISGRRYFAKGGERRTHHIHAFVAGNPHVFRHLALRDYLRVRPDEAAEYARVKFEVARASDNDLSRYCDGKDAFVKALELRALAAISRARHD